MCKKNLGDYYSPPTATEEQLTLARETIGFPDDIQIDDDARISEVDPDEDGLGGGFWIQAWVWVPTGIEE